MAINCNRPVMLGLSDVFLCKSSVPIHRFPRVCYFILNTLEEEEGGREEAEREDEGGEEEVTAEELDEEEDEEEEPVHSDSSCYPPLNM